MQRGEDSLRANDGLYSTRIVSPEKERVPATLPAVDDLLSDQTKLHTKGLDRHDPTYLHENGAEIPIVARKLLRDQLNRPKEEAGSVLSTTLSI